MSRTTIMADDALLDELREIAAEEGISLGEVIRQGLEWRAKTRRRVPSFIGAISSGHRDTSQRVDELIAEYIREKHARR
jgi:hypothetical protein